MRRIPIDRLLPFTLAICVSACTGPTASSLGNNLMTPNDGYLNAAELSANCVELKAAMASHASQVKKLQADMATELKAPAPTLDRMMKRNDGTPGGGTVAYERMLREKKAMATVNAHLEKKRCPAIDIDNAIAEAVPAAAPAAPIKAAPVRKKS